ncbi:hypothetical protein GCK32_015812, partial [Trichostrongylus colubriformis]
SLFLGTDQILLRASSVSPRPTYALETKPSQAERQNSDQTHTAATQGSTESINQSRHRQSSVTPLSSRSRTTTVVRQQTRLSRPTSALRPLANHQGALENTQFTQRADQSRGISAVRVPNPKAQLLQALISTPTQNHKDRDRNSNIQPTPNRTNSFNNRTVSAPRPSPQSGTDIPDLAALQELARQQEEALRQAVEQQQHSNVERKHSWQNDANLKSTHSSAGSLVSSKSADMSSLHRVNANISSVTIMR